jgi:hypothetical protein
VKRGWHSVKIKVIVYKAHKASVLAIRSPKAKHMHGDKKGKDPVEIDG